MQTTIRIPPTEFPLQKVADRTGAPKRAQRIPGVVYQTWVNDLLGRTHAAAVERFRDLNPELSFRLFTDEARDAYMQRHWGDHPIHSIYRRLTFGPSQADVFRYCILCERGGYYFDISKGCDAPLMQLHPPSATAIISFESNDCVVPPDRDVAARLAQPTKFVLQWGFGFEKGHPILRQMIDNICAQADMFAEKVFEIPKHGILMLTGPGMFTKSVRDALARGMACEVTQAGIDFHGHGIFELPGSEVRYLTAPPYAYARNEKILRGR